MLVRRFGGFAGLAGAYTRLEAIRRPRRSMRVQNDATKPARRPCCQHDLVTDRVGRKPDDDSAGAGGDGGGAHAVACR